MLVFLESGLTLCVNSSYCFWVAYTVIYDIVCEVRAVNHPFFSHMPKCPHMQTGASWESSLPS